MYLYLVAQMYQYICMHIVACITKSVAQQQLPNMLRPTYAYIYLCMCVTVLATVSCCGRVKASAGNHRALFVKYKDFVELEKNIYFHMYLYIRVCCSRKIKLICPPKNIHQPYFLHKNFKLLFKVKLCQPSYTD